MAESPPSQGPYPLPPSNYASLHSIAMPSYSCSRREVAESARIELLEDATVSIEHKHIAFKIIDEQKKLYDQLITSGILEEKADSECFGPITTIIGILARVHDRLDAMTQQEKGITIIDSLLECDHISSQHKQSIEEIFWKRLKLQTFLSAEGKTLEEAGTQAFGDITSSSVLLSWINDMNHKAPSSVNASSGKRKIDEITESSDLSGADSGSDSSVFGSPRVTGSESSVSSSPRDTDSGSDYVSTDSVSSSTSKPRSVSKKGSKKATSVLDTDLVRDAKVSFYHTLATTQLSSPETFHVTDDIIRRRSGVDETILPFLDGYDQSSNTPAGPIHPTLKELRGWEIEFLDKVSHIRDRNGNEIMWNLNSLPYHISVDHNGKIVFHLMNYVDKREQASLGGLHCGRARRSDGTLRSPCWGVVSACVGPEDFVNGASGDVEPIPHNDETDASSELFQADVEFVMGRYSIVLMRILKHPGIITNICAKSALDSLIKYVFGGSKQAFDEFYRNNPGQIFSSDETKLVVPSHPSTFSKPRKWANVETRMVELHNHFSAVRADLHGNTVRCTFFLSVRDKHSEAFRIVQQAYLAGCELGGETCYEREHGIFDPNNEELVEAGVDNWGEHSALMETGIHDQNNEELVEAGVDNWGAHAVKKKTGIHDQNNYAQQKGATTKSIKTFEERLPYIVSYHDMHGHTRVSIDDTGFPGLADYQKQLRKQYKKHMEKMTEGDPDELCLEWDQIWKDRHAKLAKLDFDWDPPQGKKATDDWSKLKLTNLTENRSKKQLCDYLEAKGKAVTYANGKVMTKADLAKAIKGL